MALLSRMMRTVAITGRPDSVHAWFAGRQGGRWAEQMAGTILPKAARGGRSTRSAPASSRDSSETHRELTELHRRGVITDAEFDQLRAGLRNDRSSQRA